MHSCEAGCGKTISDNKLYCFSCETGRSKATGDGEPCILVRLRSKHVDTLCRVSDGMIVAQRQGAGVLVGDDTKNQKLHGFIDEDAAIRYIRALAKIDEERDGENLIIPSNGLVTQARN